MLRIFILFALLASGYGGKLNPLSLRGLGSRIVGGEAINITEAPYQVGLLYDGSMIGDYKLRCGGSIYLSDLVVTSARCVDGTYMRWRVRAGSDLYQEGGQLHDVMSYKIHENFDSKRLDFDVAVMRTVKRIQIDNSTTKTIPLSPFDSTVSDNSSALISGWGSLAAGESPVIQLRAVNVSIINQEVCKEAYASLNPITDNMICAGNLEQGGAAACEGDYGGPLVIDGVLVGITSWGRECGLKGYPGVWSRVSTAKEWIEANSY